MMLNKACLFNADQTSSTPAKNTSSNNVFHHLFNSRWIDWFLRRIHCQFCYFSKTIRKMQLNCFCHNLHPLLFTLILINQEFHMNDSSLPHSSDKWIRTQDLVPLDTIAQL